MPEQRETVHVVVEHPSIEALFNHYISIYCPDEPITPITRAVINERFRDRIIAHVNDPPGIVGGIINIIDELIIEMFEYVRSHVDMFEVKDVRLLYNNLIVFEV